MTAKVYFDLKEFEKAQDYALKSVDIDKSHTQALIVLGDVAFRNKDYKLAESYYKKQEIKMPALIHQFVLQKLINN